MAEETKAYIKLSFDNPQDKEEASEQARERYGLSLNQYLKMKVKDLAYERRRNNTDSK
jgi:hypothetical protein